LKPEHETKINELIVVMAAALRSEARILYKSGAINAESYNENEYRLAKLILTAAIERRSEDFSPAPWDREGHQEVKNLISV
jgi:hypothetical protein